MEDWKNEANKFYYKFICCEWIFPNALILMSGQGTDRGNEIEREK